jgi:hypothetical protein
MQSRRRVDAAILRILQLAALLLGGSFMPPALAQSSPEEGKRAAALSAFATVERVFQHPRCSNCHIPGDSPLQFDSGTPHTMRVVRGPKGQGAPGYACSSCHGDINSPLAYGPGAPPGAPHWQLPPPEHKMAWKGLPSRQFCEAIKDKKFNGNRDLAALLKHVTEDKLVLWGWNPGGNRAPVPVTHAEFLASFKVWADAGAPCPAR